MLDVAKPNRQLFDSKPSLVKLSLDKSQFLTLARAELGSILKWLNLMQGDHINAGLERLKALRTHVPTFEKSLEVNQCLSYIDGLIITMEEMLRDNQSISEPQFISNCEQLRSRAKKLVANPLVSKVEMASLIDRELALLRDMAASIGTETARREMSQLELFTHSLFFGDGIYLIIKLGDFFDQEQSKDPVQKHLLAVELMQELKALELDFKCYHRYNKSVAFFPKDIELLKKGIVELTDKLDWDLFKPIGIDQVLIEAERCCEASIPQSLKELDDQIKKIEPVLIQLQSLFNRWMFQSTSLDETDFCCNRNSLIFSQSIGEGFFESEKVIRIRHVASQLGHKLENLKILRIVRKDREKKSVRFNIE